MAGCYERCDESSGSMKKGEISWPTEKPVSQELIFMDNK
jgi:hypothetical protein